MRLLVTGGAGFIGSNLIEFLLDQPGIEQLINLDCLTYAGHLANLREVEHHPLYRFLRIDLRDREAVHRALVDFDITHVMHLAAESHVDRSIAAPADFITTNIVGTFHLLEACRAVWSNACGIRRFLHVSTDEVYGSLGAEGRFTESTPYAPNSPYSASKASSDMLVRAYHQTSGLPTIITNCSNNYGPRQFPEKLIPVLIQRSLARQPLPIFGDGLHVRDWLHVRDHCDALWQVLNRGRIGETYNIGAENEWSNLRLAEYLCDLVDELAPHLGGNSRKWITHVEDRPGNDRRYAIDATKVRSELGWSPAHDFGSGLRETIAWYIQHQDWIQEVSRIRR
jgi:dTDP-glucose 4,6-dehydratase